jgi:hypothetical protein
MRERPFADVPCIIRALAPIALALQIFTFVNFPKPRAAAEELTFPPPQAWLEAASLGEPVSLAKWLMLSLQAFDNQSGVSIPFMELDYSKVIGWLDRILDLDPNGQYPLLVASRLYGEVPDAARQRQMLAFVHEKFLEDPNRRWPWLTHATIVARHRLKDNQLALIYARSLRERATGTNVPHWATQMEALLAADMHEIETAKILIGGLLDSGQITDPKEFHFLKGRLEALEKTPKAAK